MPRTGSFVGQLRRLWGRVNRTQRMALIGVAGGAIVFAYLFLAMGKTQTYVTAFTNLDPKDSAAATEQLKADGIPFQVSPDGTLIKVPSDMLADARLKLAAKGLPQGGAVGFELFDKTSFGVTDFVQHLNYQRALEGELARTINTLTQVENSRVHIVVPKEELFAAQQKPATASVVLRLRGGRSLNEGELRGIAHMVARSVEGLDEKYITVLDTSGRVLFDGGSQDTAAGLSGSQIDIQHRLEKNIEDQVQTLLDRVAGPNRAAVRVKADMDFSQSEQLSETFTPGGANNQGVPRSSSSTQEQYTGAAAQGGQPGAAANIPGGTRAGAAANNGATQYTRTETTTNYEVSKNTQRTVKGPGEVKRLSVSVILDASITEQDAIGLRDAVAAAAGINQQRGDQLVVTTANFSGAQTGEPLPAVTPAADPLGTYGKIAAPLVAALVVLFVVWRMSRSVNPRALKVRVNNGGQPALAGAGAGAGAVLGAGGVGANLQLGPQAGGNGVPSLDRPGESTMSIPEPNRKFDTPEQTRRRNEIQERMTNLATANPEAVVEIIHSWIQQDDMRKK